jgi:cytoskeleton protein RodZ
MNEAVPVNEPTNENQPTDTRTVEQMPQADVVESRLSAGAQLAACREEQGWTVEHVANQLNLAPRQIEALERDNYAALPGMVIVRGFIRAYAKILQVDSAPILASIIGDAAAPSVLPPARSEMSASFSETQLLSDKRRRGFSLKAIVAVVIVAVLAGLGLFTGRHMGWLPATSALLSSKTDQGLTHVILKKPIHVAPAASASAEQPKEQQKIVEPKPLVKPQAAAVVPSPAIEPAVPVAAAAVPVNSKNALAIHAHEDSWIEIKRADDSIVASRILKAGSSEAFEITSPMSMVIGNAAGVDVTLRGKPVDVIAGNTSNVARLNLK